MNLRLTGLAFATVLLVGCAGSSGSSDSEQQGRSDPLEGFNRVMFDFNYNCWIRMWCGRLLWRGVIMCRNRRVMGSATSSATSTNRPAMVNSLH